MKTTRTQFDTPKNKEKLAKVAIIAISIVVTAVTVDVAGEIGSYLGSVSVLLAVSFLFALLSAINSQSLVSKLSSSAFISTNIISDIRDRIVTKAVDNNTIDQNPAAVDFGNVAKVA